MKYIYTHFKAKSIGDVLDILMQLKADGYDMTAEWNGYDDGSLNIHPKDREKSVSIETFYYDRD